jgi:hypothetical protein
VIVQHIALVSEFAGVDASGLARVSAALQRQVAQDVAPIWGISATVDAFPRLEDVPAGYWPIVVTAAGLSNGELGVHLDETGQPHAYVEWSESWSITASHECIEMLVDPSGNRIVSSRALHDDNYRVEYLVEVCDPCQSAKYAYSVNDTLVTDFYTPEYFDPVPRPGVRYSFTGTLTQPRQILPDGYLSWHDPLTGDWWQAAGDGKAANLGPLPRDATSMRERIDFLTPDHFRSTQLTKEAVQARVGARHEHTKAAAQRRAAGMRAAQVRFSANSKTSNPTKESQT